MFASQAEGSTNTNHVNLHFLNVTLFVYTLNPISFYGFLVLCYALDEIKSLPNATANSMQSYGVPPSLSQGFAGKYILLRHFH
jgi:hypothetical protein